MQSKLYAIAQTILLILFGGTVFLAPRDYLFISANSRVRAGLAVGGNILGGLGILMMIVAFLSLREVIQIAPEPKPGAHLVETGIYKYLRHPIYSGIIFCVIGLFLRTPTLWIGIASIAVILFLFFKARVEERLLLEAYPGYAAYRRRTWGLFPGLRY